MADETGFIGVQEPDVKRDASTQVFIAPPVQKVTQQKTTYHFYDRFQVSNGHTGLDNSEIFGYVPVRSRIVFAAVSGALEPTAAGSDNYGSVDIYRDGDVVWKLELVLRDNLAAPAGTAGGLHHNGAISGAPMHIVEAGDAIRARIYGSGNKVVITVSITLEPVD